MHTLLCIKQNNNKNKKIIIIILVSRLGKRSSLVVCAILTFRDHVNVVSACAFSHNNHRVVTASWDKTLRVYDIATGTYRYCVCDNIFVRV